MVNNLKVKEMIKFSFYKNIQNKWFIIFNVLTLLGIITIVNWGSISTLFNNKANEDVFRVAILDSANLIYDSFVNDMSGDERYIIERVNKNEYTSDSIPDNFMIVEVTEDEVEGFKVSIISKEGINVEFYHPITEELFQLRNNILSLKYDIEKESIEVLQKDLSINRVMLSVEAEDSNTKEMVKLFSSALTYILTVFIFSKIANEIASEKQSKSTEYILTTVSSKEYLFAKIFSNIVILLLQGLFILVYYFIAALILNVTKSINMDFSLTASMVTTSINKDIVFYILALVIYNILNLILLCIIQATLAAKTSSTSEAGNAVSLLLFVMMIAYISTVYFLKPYEKVSALLYIISCIPLLSAYFVPGMMAIGQATMLQVIVSITILVISIPIIFHYCAKIFKNGILDYTKRRKQDKAIKSKEDIRKNFINKHEMKNFGFVIGIAIIIYVGTQTILSLVGNILISTFMKNVLNETEMEMVLQVVLQIVSLGLASAFVFTYVEKTENKIIKRKVCFVTKLKLVLISLFLVFALQLILSLLLYPALGINYDTTDLFKVDSSSRILSKIILVITLAVTPAFFEELFFRKAIINLSIKYGKTFALIFSACLFGLLHMNISQGLFAFMMGLLFGTIYIYTGDIKLTMLIHFLNNGFAALELILPEFFVMIAVAVLLIILMIGFVLWIKMIVNKEKREKIISFFRTKVNIKSFEEKYKYLFWDYALDVSLILILLMSIITEKMLR